MENHNCFCLQIFIYFTIAIESFEMYLAIVFTGIYKAVNKSAKNPGELSGFFLLLFCVAKGGTKKYGLRKVSIVE